MSSARKIIFGVSATLILVAAYVSLKPNVSTSIVKNSDSLKIESLRQRKFLGSDITIEEKLTPEKTYNRYIASYYSDGLKIYALLLTPNINKPQNGFPVIILNHGYIIPERYTPEGNYVSYADAFARAGYLVFKPSFRGHGKSDGNPTSAYYSPDYVIDDLNAIASIKRYPDADPKKIGIWGHSMGGNISLKDIVINTDGIKAASIWSGVVAPIGDISNNWQDKVSYTPDALDIKLRNQNKDMLLNKYGSPSQNPEFWNSIDPNSFLKDITIPVQIEVGLADTQVPPSFSKGLYERLESAGKEVEYYEYPGANHDINQSFSLAMSKTILFFNRYLK